MKIALLEDDPSQAELVMHWLTRAGHDCAQFELGQALLDAIPSADIELAVVDWQLPDLRGDQVIAALRTDLSWPGPIVLATANEEPSDITGALKLGANEYLMKPIGQAQLLSRIEALQAPLIKASATTDDVLDYEPYRLDCQSRTVSYGKKTVSLEPAEFALALMLFRNSGRMLRREELEQDAFGTAAQHADTLTSTLAKVRAKLALSPAMGWKLSGIFDQGYRLERMSS